jgi:hypothetical protein
MRELIADDDTQVLNHQAVQLKNIYRAAITASVSLGTTSALRYRSQDDKFADGFLLSTKFRLSFLAVCIVLMSLLLRASAAGHQSGVQYRFGPLVTLTLSPITASRKDLRAFHRRVMRLITWSRWFFL